MRFLKTLGWLALYTFIFFISSVLAGVFIGYLYSLLDFVGANPNSLDIFFAENLGLMIIMSGILIIAFGSLTLVARGIHPLKYLQFKRISLQDAAAATLIGIGFAIFISSLLTVIKVDSILPDTITEQMMEAIAANFPMILLAVGVVVPFYEEFLFRGLIFKEIQKSSRLWVAVVLQGLLFGIFHLNWFQFIYTFPAGVIIGMVFLRYQSIWAPILIHLGWNSTSTFLSAILPENTPLAAFLALMLLGAGLLFAGLFYTNKIRPRPLVQEIPETFLGQKQPAGDGNLLKL
ncbi:MAG: type II CAAX endopeptidase family protein [Eubacteriales bacterium]|nr:type II CAAX endopeptidase family protein [Eubacteriales bacterium]